MDILGAYETKLAVFTCKTLVFLEIIFKHVKITFIIQKQEMHLILSSLSEDHDIQTTETIFSVSRADYFSYYHI